ncbi:hypothetical protein [Ornithinimicrobium pekingense]|nr:hypothetical protein [Ornithinimicrobium pekingense]
MPQTDARVPRPAPWHPAHLALAVVAALVGMVTVVVTLRHGLDWSDEAFVWTMVASDRVAVGEAWGFQHLVHPVFVLTGESVLVMRVLRLAGYVVASVVLVAAATRVMRAAGVHLRRRERALVLLVAQVGTLLAWSYPPRYLGYNELSSWLGALLCAALSVGLVPVAEESRGRRALPWVAVGVLLAPLVIAKFTAAVVWAAVVLVVLLVPVPGTAGWLRPAAVVGGAVATTAVMAASGVPVLTVVDNSVGLLLDSSAQEASDHSVSEVLRTYLTSTRETARAAVVPVVALVTLAVLCLRVRRRTRVGAAVGLLLAAGLVALLVGPSVEGTWSGLGSVSAVVGVGGVLALVLAARATLPAAWLTPRAGVALLVALGAPLVAAVGTNNLIWGHTVFSATPWAVVCGLALCLLARAAPPLVRAAPLLLGGLLVCLAGTAVVFDVSVHPYRSEPLLRQTTPTSVPALAGMRLTEDQAATADWLHRVAVEQEAAGVPAVALHSPGHLFAFNRSGWASPWRGGIWQDSVATNCESGAPEDLFVLQPAAPADLVEAERGRLQEALTGCTLRFPEDFTAVSGHDGSVVWRLQGGAG